ncbi:MAG: T9SS type A sorting domain-containing protein [Bacteroidetes bacterium]|nr:T9SS type A sorting domain-containing protein [Bacteroidota bacterium]
MKKSILSIFLFFIIIKTATAQTKIYIGLNSHSEASGETYDKSKLTFSQRYDQVKRLADSVIAKNAKWNCQNDVSFLLGSIAFDPKKTGGTYLLKWMDATPNIECDPHCHEAVYNGMQYNYADNAHLHDSMGMRNRKNAGGFKYDGTQNGFDWQSFEKGETGNVYKNTTWKPNVLWGGSSVKGAAHTNDLNMYGAWRPSSSTDFLNHDPSKRVRVIGNGCGWVIFDTTDITVLIQNLKALGAGIENGTYPKEQFYTVSIQTNFREYGKTGYIEKVCTVMDSVNALVKRGKAQWNTITEKDSIWLNTFKGDSLKWSCGQTITAVEKEASLANYFSIYPNPATSVLNIHLPENIKTATLILTDISGKQILSENIIEASHQINISSIPTGIYIARIISDEGTKSIKVVKR